MAYSNIADIKDVLIPQGELYALVDDENAHKDGEYKMLDDRIATVIAKADAEIDALLLGLYTLPFNPVPKIITIISAKLTAYYLWARRSGEKPDNVVTEYKWCQRMLEKIARREIQLTESAPVKSGARFADAPGQVFPKSSLDKMP
jgi:phage gp36-like protein